MKEVYVERTIKTKVKAYQAEDGSIHNTLDDAIEYENFLKADELYKTAAIKWIDGESWNKIIGYPDWYSHYYVVKITNETIMNALCTLDDSFHRFKVGDLLIVSDSPDGVSAINTIENFKKNIIEALNELTQFE